MWVIILVRTTFVLIFIFNVLVQIICEGLREDMGSWAHINIHLD